ncbi:MAG: beta-ketoacyl-ACP synthase III [Planctomycetota bacterium]|nr:beta-ketoacyl-ACP synthase III [Planctomycetota bacterium]
MSKSYRAAITGMGAAVPPKVMTNADFEKILDTSDEWITQRTGIKKRHVVSDGEATVSLGTEAAKKALAEAGVEPTALDLIICATITPDMIFPASACFIQEALGATNVPAFDLSAACSGFVYGLAIASKFIETGTYRKILVLGAESLSRFSDYSDRSSCILFGDGAGAVVLEPTEKLDRGIQYTVMHADGAGWDYIHVPAGGSRTPATHETVEQHQHFVKMRGRDVYKFAVEKMQWLLADCMKQCQLSVDDVDLVIPHQVNSRIIKSATKKLDFPLEKVYVNIDEYGNTSAASIPLAMDEARQAGRIRPGSTLLLVAFGAGLTWAGAVVKV